MTGQSPQRLPNPEHASRSRPKGRKKGDQALQFLVDYERPPVIEVVCGVQFKALEAFQMPHLGLFWQQIRDEYPKTEAAAQLVPVHEKSDPQSQAPNLQFDLFTIPFPRTFFIDATGNWLVQLQQDRCLHNWRKVQDSDEYPRFPEVSKRFFGVWAEFQAFCRAGNLGEPVPDQLELTYINHIPVGDGWDSLDQISKIFPDLCWRQERSFLPESPESFSWKLAFQLPAGQGRLHVSVRHAVRLTDERQVLLCDMTARGMPAASDEQAITKWFLMAREWIVRGFADLTSKEVQSEIWGRKA